MNYIPMPDPSVFTRRRVLWLAGAGLGSAALTACGGAGNAEGQAGSSSEAGSSTPQTSSSPGASGDASATPTPVGETFSKGSQVVRRHRRVSIVLLMIRARRRMFPSLKSLRV